MRITSETVADGIREEAFTIGEIPGVLWTPAEGSGPRPLVLIGHGGGSHKKGWEVVSRAFPYVTSCGFAAAAIDAPGTGDRPEHPQIRRLVALIQEREAAGEPFGPEWPALNEVVAAQLVPDWKATLDALQQLDSVGDSHPVGIMAFPRAVRWASASSRPKSGSRQLSWASSEASGSSKPRHRS